MGLSTTSRALLVAGFALGVMPVLGANPAYACSCVATDEQQNFERATHVFKGSVNGVRSTFPADQSRGPGSSTYTFDVGTTYKGAVTDPQDVTTAGDSAACGVDLEGGGPFLVFANAGEGDAGELTMNLCGGTRAIDADAEPEFTPSDGSSGPQQPDQQPGDEQPGDEQPGNEQPGDQDPGGPAPSEPAEDDEASAVGQAITKLSDYLRELLDPLKETRAR